MKLLYDKNDAHRADVSSLRMLVYVPTEGIPHAFDVLSSKLQMNCSEAVKLLPRLEKYFVHGGIL